MGGLSFGMACTKYLLLAFNLVFWIAGISVFGVGLWSRLTAKDYEALLGDADVDKAANILIAAGLLVLGIGVLGCCGAIKENKCCLMLYALFVFLVFILEIAAGTMAYRNRDKMEEEISKAINSSVFQEYGKSEYSSVTKAVDFAQKHIDCCGANNYSDWQYSYWANKSENNGQLFPTSCCKRSTVNCTRAPLKLNDVYQEGCIKGMKDWAKEHLIVIGGIGVGIAVTQILGMIFAICLFRAIGYEKI
ncbi:CD151 antigen-like isoform X2 [Xenia sp. Carnegie-2017]|uniref:CD151 antigen-like isoform X2 n=1 Tax=Xenia sp. Carnegie-2017 TaxID=2897299 RepID=UPI001F03D848|nr:CD151 antigen-like isoform X2 [Xenia sp. Carnegie-2017]